MSLIPVRRAVPVPVVPQVPVLRLAAVLLVRDQAVLVQAHRRVPAVLLQAQARRQAAVLLRAQAAPHPAVPAMILTGREEAEFWGCQTVVWFFTLPVAVRTIPPAAMILTTRTILIPPPTIRLTAVRQALIQAPVLPLEAALHLAAVPPGAALPVPDQAPAAPVHRVPVPHRAAPVRVPIAILPALVARLTKMKGSCWQSLTGPITRLLPVVLSTWGPATLLFPGAVLRIGSRSGTCTSISKRAAQELPSKWSPVIRLRLTANSAG